MSDLDQACAAAMQALNGNWFRIANRLIQEAQELGEGTTLGDAVTKTMLATAIGLELRRIGFAQMSADLRAVAENFGKIAAQVAVIDEAGNLFTVSDGDVVNSTPPQTKNPNSTSISLRRASRRSPAPLNLSPMKGESNVDQ